MIHKQFTTPDFNQFPQLPGVYFFKNNHGEILYIGKACNLRKRIRSYFAHRSVDWKVTELIKRFSKIEFIITKTEQEACIVEAQLISTHKPSFNTLLKSDTPFLYLICDDGNNEILPSFSITRALDHPQRCTVFGPFLQKTAARSVYFFLTKTFALHRCNKKIERGCLEFHLGLCAGSCISSFDEKTYRERYYLAKAILTHDQKEFLKTLDASLADAIKNRAFEHAQKLVLYKNNFQSIFDAVKTNKDNKYQEDIETILSSLLLSQEEKNNGLESLQKILDLENPIHIVDCIDISHFQSHALVGSCVRFIDGIYSPKNLKLYKITTLSQQNDCAAIQEIMRKRYGSQSDLPDVIMIDGGKGQVNSARSVIQDVPIIALAKREERLYTPESLDGICISAHTKMGGLLMALRDCAHRTALNFHKKLFLNKHIGSRKKSK